MRNSLSLLLLSISVSVYSQSNITIASGFSINGFNKPGSNTTFNHIPISVQWSPFGFSKVFLVKLDYFIPFKTTASDNAFTANPALPAEIQVTKTIKPNMFNLSAGARIPIHRYRGNYNFYADALLGFVSHQNIKVVYNDYDKNNYEILNQDFSLNKTSISFSLGLVYKYSLVNHDNVLFMFHLQSPLLAPSNIHGYQLSYSFVAPLQLTIGYNFVYKKNKNVK